MKIVKPMHFEKVRSLCVINDKCRQYQVSFSIIVTLDSLKGRVPYRRVYRMLSTDHDITRKCQII